jgi:hypothetical protein
MIAKYVHTREEIHTSRSLCPNTKDERFLLNKTLAYPSKDGTVLSLPKEVGGEMDQIQLLLITIFRWSKAIIIFLILKIQGLTMVLPRVREGVDNIILLLPLNAFFDMGRRSERRIPPTLSYMILWRVVNDFFHHS